MSMKPFVFMWVGSIFLFAGPAPAADTCDEARGMAEKAASAYKKDKKRGIDLFMKAHRLCPKNAAFAYNVGTAWYGYGDLVRAQKYLETAVKMDGSRALWHNNLASVMIERGDDIKGAFFHAQKAAGLDPDSVEIQQTLASARKSSRAAGGVDVDTKIPRGTLKRPYGVAVVIGNQRYEAEKKGLSDVKYAERDASAVKRYLVQVMGYDPGNIIYRTDVSSGDMRNIFGSKNNPEGMLHRYVRKGRSEVFVYYVGHGAPGPGGGANYLVPVDAAVDYIANNGYSLELFYRILSKLPAKDVTVVLDACFSGYSASGPLFKNISPGMLKSKLPVRKMANGAVFCGAGKDQVCTWYPAKRHSLFTYFFLKGLGGAADNNGDRAITTGEMKIYLQDEVPYWAGREANRKQNPLVTGDGSAVLTRLE